MRQKQQDFVTVCILEQSSLAAEQQDVHGTHYRYLTYNLDLLLKDLPQEYLELLPELGNHWDPDCSECLGEQRDFQTL